MDEEYFCNSKLKKIEKVKISFLPSSSYTHGLMAEGYFHNLKLKKIEKVKIPKSIFPNSFHSKALGLLF